ncbi:MAG: alpha/beta hydrolase fold domain-containing protein [Spirochaetes bacterium]|nr:alpha/beta hydrolase fold domain-containing protein [Spirochaetota bacterium]
MPLRFESLYLDDVPRDGRVVDFFDPAGAPREKAFFFVHGGGWRAGSRSIFHPIIKALVDRGYACATTDYRLGGVHLSEQVADVREAYGAFSRRLAAAGRPLRAVVHGGSAGAHLAALLALAGPEKPCGLSLANGPSTFEPWPDIFPGIWASMQDIMGVPWETHPERYREASPIHHIRAGHPPILFMHAENEHMFPLAQTLRLQRAVETCGGRMEIRQYPAMEHGFFYSLERPQQRAALEDLVAFAESIP